METASIAPSGVAKEHAKRQPRMFMLSWIAAGAARAGGAGGAAAATAAAAVLAIVVLAGNPGWPDTAAAALAEGAPAPPLARLDQQFEAARSEFDAGHRVEAFAAIAALADQGHCQAARLALQSVHAGAPSERAPLRAGPQQIERWRRLSACPANAAAR